MYNIICMSVCINIIFTHSPDNCPSPPLLLLTSPHFFALLLTTNPFPQAAPPFHSQPLSFRAVRIRAGARQGGAASRVLLPGSRSAYCRDRAMHIHSDDASSSRPLRRCRGHPSTQHPPCRSSMLCLRSLFHRRWPSSFSCRNVPFAFLIP